MKNSQVVDLLEMFYLKYNQFDFIKDDPIQIPHRFTKLQDIEISAFFASIFAWGLRKTIINKTNELMAMMDNDPHNFILYHKETDLKRIESFKHRTFNATDALYFIHFLKHWYNQNESLEQAFCLAEDSAMGARLAAFNQVFFSLEDAPQRTRKHIANPIKKSTCKRLNMFLRWMVRKDEYGVDLGIWKKIKPNELMCPLDVHVERSARKLKLIKRKQRDWQTVVELSDTLRKIDPVDPIRFDLALFGMGLENFEI